MVTNIRDADTPIHIEGISKDKVTVCDKIADSEHFGVVYFTEEATANIVSLSGIQSKMSVDIIKNNKDIITAFQATSRTDGNKFIFRARCGGLFSYEGVRIVDEGRVYVNTVRENKRKFTKKQIAGADRAMLLRSRLSFPSIAEFKRMVYNSTMKEFDITTKDIDNMIQIYGTQYADAAGKTTYVPTPTPNPDNIPDAAAAFVENMKKEPLNLYGDIFFVDKMAFLLTVSRPLNYVICTYLKSRSWKDIFQAIATHKNTYSEHGYSIDKLRFDREKGVVCLREHLLNKLGITLDTSAPYQKVSIAERKIRLVKERMRAEIHNLGYRINRTMLAYLPKYIARRINATTSRIIAINVSPTELLSGNKISSKVELKIGFGEYAYVHSQGRVATNGVASRAKVGICLGLSHNQEASAIFYDVSKPANQTPIIADNFKVAPMPEQILWYMNDLADNKPVSFDEAEMEIVDDAEAISVEDDTPPVPSSAESDIINELIQPEDIPAEDLVPVHDTADAVEIIIEDSSPLRENFIDDLIVEGDPFEEDDTDDDINAVIEAVALRGELRGDNENHTQELNDNAISTNTNSIDADTFISSIINQPTINNNMEIDTDTQDTNINQNETTVPIENHYERTTRSKKKMIYAVSKVEMHKVIGCKAYHISMKKGIAMYGNEASRSIFAEVEAMEKKKVFTPVHHGQLTPKQKYKAIRSFMFLKEKMKPDGSFDKLKSRLTANGKTQCREEVEQIFGNTSSPTVAFSSIMSIIAIAKAEGRKIATVDIKNAYLNADLKDEGLIIILDAVVAAEYIKIRPDAEQYLNHKGELYCQLNRALYGTIEGAKAWYNDISEFLISNGFIANSHDPCVFNADIDGTQITVAIYVDDLLITCQDVQLVDYFKEALVEKYAEISFSDDIKLNYLGMIIDSTNDDFIEISMPSYIQSIIDDLKLKDDQTSASPAAVNLFEINPEDVMLKGEDKEFFHTMVAKVLYLAKHARPDILLASTFLCTRVQCPGKEDMKKLVRVGRYLNGSKDIFLRIKKNGVNIGSSSSDTIDVNVYVDASFAVHDTMRSHTGAIISIDGVAVFYKSMKQKLNANSSTQAEIIAISDILPQAISTAGFISEQMGRKVLTTFHEDNKSTIAMMKNGRPKAENTRHINIRYFHISDYIERDEIVIKYVDTNNQHADYYTKPLQGQSFEFHRNYIMGH